MPKMFDTSDYDLRSNISWAQEKEPEVVVNVKRGKIYEKINEFK